MAGAARSLPLYLSLTALALFVVVYVRQVWQHKADELRQASLIALLIAPGIRCFEVKNVQTSSTDDVQQSVCVIAERRLSDRPDMPVVCATQEGYLSARLMHEHGKGNCDCFMSWVLASLQNP